MIRIDKLSNDIQKKMMVSVQSDKSYFISAIKNKMCQLWKWKKSYLITRIEVNKHKQKIFVVCCFEGSGLIEFTKKLIIFCKKNNISFIRFHTQLEKLGRVMIKRFSFFVFEKRESEKIYILRL